MLSDNTDVAIKVENLSKCYYIYDKPQDRLKQMIYPRFQRMLRKKPKVYHKEFWALKNVSFQVKRGETVGVIGRNGSGKSTLLQMICGTLNPTGGDIKINGRVAALLELGSGFNPEFTGRENVYLNASVLGLRAEEIDARFDDIVAFADIGEHLDQPVKTYSSGMYVRLAFAVIAHVDADILVVDEALAVGDAIFTQKCMRYIRRFQEYGSLIFVSHDLSAVQNLCKKAVWINNGSVKAIDESKIVAEMYTQFTQQEIYGDEYQLESLSSLAKENLINDSVSNTVDNEMKEMIDYNVEVSVQDNTGVAKGWKTGVAEIISVTLISLSPESRDIYQGGEKVRLTIRAKVHEPLKSPILGFLVRDRLGQDLFGENTLPITSKSPVSVGGNSIIEGIFEFIMPMLPNGDYAVMASVADGDLHDNIQHHWLHDALIFHVSSSRVRWGLVGIPFDHVAIEIVEAGDDSFSVS